LEEKEQDTTSVFAEEGTLAHEICELMCRYNNGEFKKATYTRRINKLKEHELFTIDMLDYCNTYATIVREKFQEAKKRTPGAVLLLEQRLDFSEYVPEGFGTGDAVIIADGAVEVIDFKYGIDVPVYAEDNSQMKLYGLGALAEFDMLYDVHDIKMTIVQPRLENISGCEMLVEDLKAWGEEVRVIAEQAFNGDGEFKAGSHCRFCKVKAKCRAYAEEQLEIAKYEFRQGPFLAETEIADILGRADELKKWLTAVDEYALDQAVNHGVSYPGYKLVEGRSVRKYISEEDVAHQLVDTHHFAEDEIYEKKLLGITKMEKTLGGKKKFTELLSDYVIKPPGKPTLVPESDKRPEWHSEDEAVNDFK
jgi:hypothetical protein